MLAIHRATHTQEPRLPIKEAIFDIFCGSLYAPIDCVQDDEIDAKFWIITHSTSIFLLLLSCLQFRWNGRCRTAVKNSQKCSIQRYRLVPTVFTVKAHFHIHSGRGQFSNVIPQNMVRLNSFKHSTPANIELSHWFLIVERVLVWRCKHRATKNMVYIVMRSGNVTALTCYKIGGSIEMSNTATYIWLSKMHMQTLYDGKIRDGTISS